MLDTTSVLFAATRAVHLSACVMLFGLVLFEWLVVGEHVCGERVREKRIHHNIAADWRSIRRRWTMICLPIVAISGAAWFGFVAIAMSDLPVSQALQLPVLRLVWSSTYFGHVWRWRAVFLLAMFVAAIVQRSRILPFVSSVCSLLFVASLAASGHGQTGSAPTLHVCADVTHLLIASIWPTGLLPLLILLWRVKAQPTIAAELIARFSSVALFAVILLTVTGIVNAWCLVGSFHALFTSKYGQTLDVKLIVLVFMLIAAAFNRFILKPRLGLSAIRTSVAIEFGLGVIVLIVTGLLGVLPPPRM